MGKVYAAWAVVSIYQTGVAIWGFLCPNAYVQHGLPAIGVGVLLLGAAAFIHASSEGER